MKKIHKTPQKRHAFSLAEALITLLIVCLITLASIPILTKKKRDFSTGAHGTYICTAETEIRLNEDGEWERGNIVKYKQKNSSTTDEWQEVQKCSFYAPTNAGIFVTTVIGGGGGGGTARSEKQDVVPKTTSSSSYNPAKDGYYYFEMVGGGGGGAGASYRSRKNDRANCGGAGGSGAFATGAAYLLRGTTYYYGVGTGGGSIGGDWKSHSSRAGDGGTTYFRDGSNGDNIYVEVTGGQGGQNRNCKRVKWNKCWGGAPGAGGAVTKKKVNEPGDAKGLSYVSQVAGRAATNKESYTDGINWYRAWTYWGGMGGWGGCHRDGSPKYPSNTRYARTFTDADGNAITDPGFSLYRTSQTSGESGYFYLYQIHKWHGSGGQAAEPNNVVVGNIKPSQKITMTIGLGGEANERGGDSVLEIGSLTGSGSPRKIIGYGGGGGTADESLTEPEYGENSGWTSEGGGIAGTCTDPKNEPYTETIRTPEPYETDVCDPTTYVCTNSKDSSGLVSDGAPILMLYDEIIQLVNHPNTAEGEVGWEDIAEEMGDAGLTKDDFFKSTTLEDGTIQGPRMSETADGCYKASDNDELTFVRACTDHIWETRYKEENITHSVTPALCENAGNGDPNLEGHYGAGGGGGMASETIGVAGHGGLGANGAIIIEW